MSVSVRIFKYIIVSEVNFLFQKCLSFILTETCIDLTAVTIVKGEVPAAQ